MDNVKEIPPITIDWLERTAQKFTISDSGCWSWNRFIGKNGYSQVSMNGVVYSGHRIMYTAVKGEIAKGLQLDHLCRNRACINPSHLEPVTLKLNLQRGRNWQREKTHCPKGHEYTDMNIIRDIIGRRKCKQCSGVAVDQAVRHASEFSGYELKNGVTYMAAKSRYGRGMDIIEATTRPLQARKTCSRLSCMCSCEKPHRECRIDHTVSELSLLSIGDK